MSGRIIEKSHNDIFKRLEKVEIDVAVLDSKSNRLHQDMKDIQTDVKETGRVARRIQTLVVVVPSVLGAVWMMMNIMERVINT